MTAREGCMMRCICQKMKLPPERVRVRRSWSLPHQCTNGLVVDDPLPLITNAFRVLRIPVQLPYTHVAAEHKASFTARTIPRELQKIMMALFGVGRVRLSLGLAAGDPERVNFLRSARERTAIYGARATACSTIPWLSRRPERAAGTNRYNNETRKSLRYAPIGSTPVRTA